MTNIIREPEITTVVVDATERLVVMEDRPSVISAGTQGPPGPQGPAGPQGPTGTLDLPSGNEGGVLFKYANSVAIDAAKFRYDTVAQALNVSTIMNATLDGGNF